MAVSTQFVSQLQSGNALQGKVMFVDVRTVFLEFPSLLNLTGKDVLGKIDAGVFGKNTPNEGTKIDCTVISVSEDDEEFTIVCQLAHV